MDRAVVHAVLNGSLDHPVLIDAALPGELRRPHDGAQMIPSTLVDHLHLGARQGGRDQPLDLSEVGSH